MKQVTFEIAKALKDSGYPQGNINSGNDLCYALEDHTINYTPYVRAGQLTTRYRCETFAVNNPVPYAIAPTYMDVWICLWKSKNIYIQIDKLSNNKFCTHIDNMFCGNTESDDQEETLIAAIEYLAANDLIRSLANWSGNKITQ